MPLETANYISQLDASNPDGLTDYVSQGDDHLRLIKTAVTQSFPNITSAVVWSSTEMNDIRTNMSHTGTVFDFNGNSLTDIVFHDSDSAAEPRSYNDARYVRPAVAVSTSVLLANNVPLNVTTTGAVVTPAVKMDASNILQIGNSVTPGVVNVSATAFNYNGVNIADIFYPVGTIYENGVNATNPGTLLGFGTWSRYADGRVLVGTDPTSIFGATFTTGGLTGGTTTHTLTEAELPAHSHTHPSRVTTGALPGETMISTNAAGTATTTSATTGSGSAHQNCQPYITIFRWIRTA